LHRAAGVRRQVKERRKRAIPVQVNHRKQDQDIAERVAGGVRIGRETSNNRPASSTRKRSQ
jgi:hypothetical protein